jgi:predicted ArsR family transcriptional regulator
MDVRFPGLFSQEIRLLERHPVDKTDFAAQISGVATLAEPIRRELYLYVAAQPEPISRDQACEGVGVARHTAKFHLDKLVEEGLLEVDFKRLSGRRGPGAGRPTKLYRRSTREVAVALPERHYDLAGQLMAQAIDDSIKDGTSVLDALHRAAADRGTALGEQTMQAAGRRPNRERLVAATCETLATHGYEPRRNDHTVTLTNCPFHALAAEHTELVCGMNLALIDALVAPVGENTLTAQLSPAPNRCCVLLTTPNN